MGRSANVELGARLTPKQAAVLTAYAELSASLGYPPTMRQLADALGYSSVGSVHFHVESLVKQGSLNRQPSTPRAITVSKPSPRDKGERRAREMALWSPTPGESTMLVPTALVDVKDAVVVRLKNPGPSGSAILAADWVIVRRLVTELQPEFVVWELSGEAHVAHSSDPRPGGAVVVGGVVAVMRSLRAASAPVRGQQTALGSGRYDGATEPHHPIDQGPQRSYLSPPR
jgi:repressor LexA